MVLRGLLLSLDDILNDHESMVWRRSVLRKDGEIFCNMNKQNWSASRRRKVSSDKNTSIIVMDFWEEKRENKKGTGMVRQQIKGAQ